MMLRQSSGTSIHIVQQWSRDAEKNVPPLFAPSVTGPGASHGE